MEIMFSSLQGALLLGAPCQERARAVGRWHVGTQGTRGEGPQWGWETRADSFTGRRGLP